MDDMSPLPAAVQNKAKLSRSSFAILWHHLEQQTYTANSHQGVIEIFWALMSSIFIYIHLYIQVNASPKDTHSLYIYIIFRKILKILISLPGNFTFVDLEAPLGHVPHPLLALPAAVHGQIVYVRSLIRHFKVADAAVPLWEKMWKSAACVHKTEPEPERAISTSNLAAEVDYSCVCVEKRQEDAAAGVQLLQGQRLAKVFLEFRHIQRVRLCVV